MTWTWFAGVQSNVPFFLGHTRTNLPFCTCSRTKQAEVTLPPTFDFAMKPSASKLVRFFSAARKFARVMPLFLIYPMRVPTSSRQYRSTPMYVR